MDKAQPMVGVIPMLPCWESSDGRCMHYFSGGPTCHCGKQEAQGAGHCVRTHLSLVEAHREEKLNL